MDHARPSRWRNKGLIGFEAEQRIVESEGGTYRDAEQLRWREGLAYLGGLLVLGGGLALALDIATPTVFGRSGDAVGGLLVTAMLAFGLAAAALALNQGDPVSDRAVGFLASTSVVAVAGFAGIVFFDLINPAEGSFLMFSIPTGAAAFVAWRWMPTALTLTALHVTNWFAVIGVLIVVGVDTRGLDLSGLGVLSGLLFVALGMAWLTLTYFEYLQPRTAGYVLGILAAYLGSQILIAVATGWVVVGLALGAGLVGFGIRESRSVVIFLGCYVLAGSAGVALSNLFDGTRAVATAATVAGAAALGAAFLIKDQGSWRPVAPLGETTDGPPPASPF